MPRPFFNRLLMLRTKGLAHPFFHPVGGGLRAVAPRAWREHPHPHEDCLLTNSDFSGGTTGWAGSNATLSESGGVLLVTNTGTDGYARQTVTVEDGETYEITARFIRDGTGSDGVGYIHAVSGLVNYNSGTLTGTQEHVFQMVASGTSLSLDLGANGAAGHTALYDYACIRKIS